VLQKVNYLTRGPRSKLSRALGSLTALPFPSGPHLAEQARDLLPELAELDSMIAGMSANFDNCSGSQILSVKMGIAELDSRARQLAGKNFRETEWGPLLKYLAAMKEVIDCLDVRGSEV
jgi:hypothetical protein